MDIGAMLCVRRRPLCGLCPIAQRCVARTTGRQNELPAPRPRKSRPQRKTCMLMLVRENRFVLLERRPPAGIWGGLWSLPEFESLQAAQEWYALQFGVPPVAPRSHPPLHHAFTHFDLQIDPLRIDCGAHFAVMEEGKWLWYDRAAPARLGLAAPVNQLIQKSLFPLSAPAGAAAR